MQGYYCPYCKTLYFLPRKPEACSCGAKGLFYAAIIHHIVEGETRHQFFKNNIRKPLPSDEIQNPTIACGSDKVTHATPVLSAVTCYQCLQLAGVEIDETTGVAKRPVNLLSGS